MCLIVRESKPTKEKQLELMKRLVGPWDGVEHPEIKPFETRAIVFCEEHDKIADDIEGRRR